VTLPVKGLNFAGCIREIEKHLSKLVEDCGFPCGEPLTRFSGRGATGPLRPEAVHAHGTAGHPAVEDHAAHEKMEMGIVDHHIMGHGTGAAIETAEVVLMHSDPLHVLGRWRPMRCCSRAWKRN